MKTIKKEIKTIDVYEHLGYLEMVQPIIRALSTDLKKGTMTEKKRAMYHSTMSRIVTHLKEVLPDADDIEKGNYHLVNHPTN